MEDGCGSSVLHGVWKPRETEGFSLRGRERRGRIERDKEEERLKKRESKVRFFGLGLRRLSGVTRKYPKGGLGLCNYSFLLGHSR